MRDASVKSAARSISLLISGMLLIMELDASHAAPHGDPNLWSPVC